MVKIAAIILAAGKGERLGQPKMFLRANNRTFLEMTIASLEEAGISDITVAVRGETEKAAKALAGGCRIVVNQHPDEGPLSSLRAGLDAAQGFGGYVVAPVDHPFVRPETITGIIWEYKKDPHRVVKPSCHGKDGHPIIIPPVLAGMVPASDIEGGLARLITDSGIEIARVRVDDGGTVRNINTKDDYR